MDYRKTLMTGLIGFAMLAMPIAAAAQNNESGKYDSHRAQSQYNHNESVSHGPAHSEPVTRNVAPAPEARHDFRDQRADRNWDGRAVNAPDHRRFENRNDLYGWDHERDIYDRRYYNSYPRSAYPYYEMPGGFAGGSCAWARHLRGVYNHDENTGHPAAAQDVLNQLRRAERNCGGPYGYNR